MSRTDFEMALLQREISKLNESVDALSDSLQTEALEQKIDELTQSIDRLNNGLFNAATSADHLNGTIKNVVDSVGHIATDFGRLLRLVEVHVLSKTSLVTRDMRDEVLGVLKSRVEALEQENLRLKSSHGKT